MSQHLSLGLRQEQKLTPQLIQSMNILQLPLLALEAKIQEEMERNPALEDANDASSDMDASPPSTEPVDPEKRREENQEAESFSRLDRFSREYDIDDSDQSFGRARRGGEERDAKMDAMANTASRPESLTEYLEHQWVFIEMNGRIRQAGDLILKHINDEGYLDATLEAIADKAVPPFALEEMEEALTWVQTLEPAGVGARDLKECLLIQLAALDGDYELERTIVEHHLTDIEKNRYPAISKATGRSIDEIKEAVGHLRNKLHPHPGLQVGQRDVPHITPDVIVDYAEDSDGYTIRLARGNNPRLRISGMYKRMLEDKTNGKDARDFIRKNLESASALIDAIQYRRSRLLEVAQEVIERQAEFLEVGPPGLKVLRMSELAEKLGCDPSTISRTVAEKYIQLPRGIYPLRYFFTGGTESSDGEATSWDSVKASVKEIIDKEDKQNPLSDEVVAAKLQADGIDVSRRTIAKYRQQMHIPSARERKEF